MFKSPLNKARQIALGALILSALTSQISAQSGDLHLEVFVNGFAKKLIAKFSQNDEGRLFSEAKELREIGIKPPNSAKDSDIVPLDGLNNLTYIYDQTTQTIKFTASLDEQEAKNYEANDGFKEKERTVAKRDFGAVLNYSLYSAVSNNFNSGGTQFSGISGTFNSRVFGPLGTFNNAFMLGNATTIRRENIIRLDTSWSYSDPNTLTTVNAGDIIAGGHTWTRPVRMGGVQFERNFGLRPDLIATALPGISGSAAVPSTVDVYVNNTKTYSQDVGAGPFRISNLPVMGSNGTARIVVTEPNGRQTEQAQNYFVSSRLLAKGNFDYSIQAGYPRLEFGVNSANYTNKLTALAATRYGITDSFTLENYAETTDKFLNVGVGIAASLQQKHLLTLAGQVSSYQGKKGFNLYGSFESSWQQIYFSLSSQRSFGDYADLASVTAKAINYTVNPVFNPFATPTNTGLNTSYSSVNQSLLPPRAIDRVTVGAPLSFLKDASVSSSYIHMLTAEGARSHLFNVSFHKSFSKYVSTYLTVFTDRGDKKNLGFFAGLIVPFGKDRDQSYASLGVLADQAGNYLTADYAKPLGTDIDRWGYRFRDVEGKNSYRSANVSYRSRYGKVEVTGTHMNAGGHGMAYVEGAIAAAGGGLFLTNRIDDSFAVVKAGAPNIEVFSENRLVGRTGANGRIIVPTLRSNETNRVTINPIDLPINATIDTTKTIAIPADRGVSIVDFGVITDPKAATVIFKDKTGQSIPAGTTGEDEAGDKFIVGYDGRSFLKNLNPLNKVSLNVKGVTCEARFNYNPDPQAMTVIGPILCQ